MLSPTPEYTNCPGCGTSIAPEALERHDCDQRHRDDHLARTVSAEAELFEREYHRFLATPRGRFELFYASRTRAP